MKKIIAGVLFLVFSITMLPLSASAELKFEDKDTEYLLALIDKEGGGEGTRGFDCGTSCTIEAVIVLTVCGVLFPDEPGLCLAASGAFYAVCLLNCQDTGDVMSGQAWFDDNY